MRLAYKVGASISQTSPSLLYGGTTERLGVVSNVTASASTHTWGSWSQVIASTSSELAGLTFVIDGVGNAATNTGQLLRVGIGAAAAEVELCRFAVGGALIVAGVGLGPLVVSIPVYIPRGVRVALSNQAVIASDVARVAVFGHPLTVGMSRQPSTVVSLGTDTATSTGTALTNANTWYEITSSTAQAFQAIAAVPSLSTTGATDTSSPVAFDVGVGASGAEVVIASGFARVTSDEVVCTSGPPILAARHIPAGSRLSARTAASSAGIGMSLIGVPYA
jgi:hypothetical protein